MLLSDQKSSTAIFLKKSAKKMFNTSAAPDKIEGSVNSTRLKTDRAVVWCDYMTARDNQHDSIGDNPFNDVKNTVFQKANSKHCGESIESIVREIKIAKCFT